MSSVNEVFDPEKVDEFYNFLPTARKETLIKNRSTNYGVVRPELLDRLYENMYYQRLRESDEEKWRYKIIPRRLVHGFEKEEDEKLRLQMQNTIDGKISSTVECFDLVIVATGYTRNFHEALLEPTRQLLETGNFDVGRDYRVKYQKHAVSQDCGIWLQGCCEDSHGV